MSRLTIAISGLNATDNPGPGVAVARSLKASKFSDCRIIGLCYGSMEPGAYMRDLIDKSYQIPYPSTGIETLFSRLAYIHQKENIDVIVPNFDAELFSYIKLESRLSAIGIRMCLPTMEQFEMRQKSCLSVFGKNAQILVPDSLNCTTLDDFLSVENEWQYPVVVKGRYYEAYVVKSRDQFISSFSLVASRWGVPVIVQKFIEGSEFNVIGMGDGKGKLLSAVPMRKQYVTDKGKAWAGVTIHDDELLNLSKKFVEKTAWKGGFELELIKDEKGQFFLLEINPRIPAWVYLATAAGQNIPEQTVLLARQENVVSNSKYEVGKMFIRYSWDMIVDYSDFGSFSTLGEL